MKPEILPWALVLGIAFLLLILLTLPPGSPTRTKIDGYTVYTFDDTERRTRIRYIVVDRGPLVLSVDVLEKQ